MKFPDLPGKNLSDAADAARPETLAIEYSTTRVVAGAIARLQRSQGVVQADRSPLAESFKMLRNRVLQRLRQDGHSVLAVTSARRIDGKSLAAVNLALALAADYDRAVLLVDAELSGQGLQALFGLAGAPGLGDHLALGTPIAELLVNPGIERFVLLPAGRAPAPDSAELLATRRAQTLLQEMKLRYADRVVIVDLPPLLDTADALAFLPHVDTTLMVVEEGTTTLDDLEHVAELLTPFNLIGVATTQPREPEPGRSRPAPWYRRWRRRKSSR